MWQLWEVIRTWGWTIINGISALLEGNPETSCSRLIFPPCEDTMKSHSLLLGRQTSAEPNHASILISDFLASKTERSKFLLYLSYLVHSLLEQPNLKQFARDDQSYSKVMISYRSNHLCMNFNDNRNEGIPFLVFIFFYLTMPSLSYGTGDLRSSLWHTGCLIVACRIFSCSIRILSGSMWYIASWPGI